MMDRSKYLKSAAWLGKQILFVLLVAVALGFWQTRQLPDAVPELSLKNPVTDQVVKIPTASDATSLTLIYGFAPWCSVCRLSMPGLEWIKRSLPNITIIPIALDYESLDDVASFVKDSGYSGPYFIGDAVVRDALRIQAYPTYLIVDTSGIVRGSSVGYTTGVGVMARILWALTGPTSCC
jgi:thiol-disulfide isomerase/thioredoxin